MFTVTDELSEPSVSPANDVKSSRTWRVSVLPAQGPGGTQVGELGPPVGSAIACAAPPAYETCDVPAFGKKPSGSFTLAVNEVASEQSRSKSRW